MRDFAINIKLTPGPRVRMFLRYVPHLLVVCQVYYLYMDRTYVLCLFVTAS